MSERLNLGELRRDGVLFYTREAAAILYEIASQLNYAEEIGHPLDPPRLDQLHVTRDGELVLDVPVRSTDAASNSMPVLASLIEQVLPPTLPDQPDYSVPGSFRVLAPRCRGWPPGLPPISTSGDLAAAIRRYQSGDSAAILKDLFARCVPVSSSAEPPAIANAAAPTVAAAPASGDTHTLPKSDHSNSVPASEAAAQIRDSAFTADLSQRDLADVPLWFPSAEQPDAEEEEPELELAPAHTAVAPASFRHRLIPAGLTGYRRQIVWTAILVLLAFGASYEVTHWVVSRQARTAYGEEKRSSVDDAQETPAAIPSPQPQPQPPRIPPPADAAASRSDVPAPDSNAASASSSTSTSLSAAPLKIPASTGPTFSPSFGASGSLLVFHAGRDPSARVMRTDLRQGTAALNVIPILDDAARNYHPRLSPDGRYLAFDSDRDGVRGVYVADRDGTHQHRVSGEGFAAIPSWSPDMHWLAFVRGESTRPRVWNLWLHDLSTGSERRLTNYRYGQTWGASWFAGSHRLCFSHEDRLVILDLDTGQTQQFRSPYAGRLVRTPAVSPDGQRIVFQVSRSGVWLFYLKSQSMHRILDDVTAEEFAWAPDARRVAYHSRRTGAWQIWLATMSNELLAGP